MLKIALCSSDYTTVTFSVQIYHFLIHHKRQKHKPDTLVPFFPCCVKFEVACNNNDFLCKLVLAAAQKTYARVQ